MITVLMTLSLAHAQELPFERYQLPNGLQVILHEDHSLPQVVVDVWYRVGSKDEAPGRSGFAHLFEHLMFMGTNRLPGSGIDQLMEANGGANNAWTMEDATNYYDWGPPQLLETLLWIEADRMEQLGQAMTQDKVDLQRDVVRNERRQTSEDAPYGVGDLEIPGLMYPAGHPYAHTVIGTHEDLQAATLQDVKDFFATWYVPNNASLVVAGDFDSARIKPIIDRYFGHIPAKALPARNVQPQPAKAQKDRVTVPDQVQYPRVTMLWHSPAGYQPGDAEMSLIASLLTEGESSRLYRKLVVTGMAQDVTAYQYPTQLGGLFMIQATAAEGTPIDKIEAVIRAELTDLAAHMPTEAEMQRLKNNTEYSFLAGLEGLKDRAEQINRYAAYTGSPDYLAKDLARYREASPASLTAAAARYLAPELAGVVVVVPEAAPEGGAK